MQKTIPRMGYERVVLTELVPGIFSILAIHSTRLGPALGGVRFYPYATQNDALEDVTRLAQAMTNKAALANLPLGGGKAVIIGDPRISKTREVLLAFGDFINTFGGAYITAKDVGITVEDLAVIAEKSKYVSGFDRPGSSGDPSPMTAYGVSQGMRACAQFRWKEPSLKNRGILVQGLGRVGWETTKYLLQEGAQVVATDTEKPILERAKKDLGIRTINPEYIFDTMGDIFCPCAMGAILQPRNISKLKEHGVQIVAGGANSQLADETRDGALLHLNGILYAPDYVINAGGLINIACEIDQEYDSIKARKWTDGISHTLLEIFDRSKSEDLPTSLIAEQMARERLTK